MGTRWQHQFAPEVFTSTNAMLKYGQGVGFEPPYNRSAACCVVHLAVRTVDVYHA